MSRTVLPSQVPVLLAAGLTLASPLLLAVQTSSAVPNPPPNEPSSVYVYLVKIVCATDTRDGSVDFAGGGPSLGSTDDVLADVDLFQTAVNVFNTGEFTAELRTDVILAHDPRDDPKRWTSSTSRQRSWNFPTRPSPMARARSSH